MCFSAHGAAVSHSRAVVIRTASKINPQNSSPKHSVVLIQLCARQAVCIHDGIAIRDQSCLGVVDRIDHKLSRLFIDDQQSTVILLGGIESTVDIIDCIPAWV